MNENEEEVKDICIREDGCFLASRWWGHDGRACSHPRPLCWLTIGKTIESEPPGPDQ
jgi:hypothetical protein